MRLDFITPPVGIIGAPCFNLPLRAERRRRIMNKNFLAIAFAAVTITQAAAQAPYPAKPVRMVVPSSAGGGSDIIARIIAPKLGERLGQQIVVENRAGAGTMIGSEAVARA